MDIILYFLPAVAVIGGIMLLVGFKSKFNKLTLVQKLGIILVEIGVITPAVIDFATGFMQGVIKCAESF
ncbi:hypothetical protein [Clostridium sp.]|uniref:hypothetical protein n=1 Tax=Clostridium sp. TaxID=1506 RepID=UPI0026DC4FDB|nr:hypothetical protein [Clostridium sp.]MDO5039975.1 hypothetical protein [Clostridium sp.]